jgi:CheY-like chemotaxis protein
MQQSALPVAATMQTAWYVVAMEKLVGVVQQLSQARDVDAIAVIVREAARDLTGADGATFVLRDGDQCYYVDENAIGPLWKGQRFPIDACISGWVMRNARPATINDIYGDARVPADAYRPTFVKSLAMVPINRMAPVGAIGNYWATRHLPTSDELFILQALGDATSVALRNAALLNKLREQLHALEEQPTASNGKCDAPLANVLLVDDSEDYLELAKAILFEGAGLQCNLTTARDGKEALDAIRRAADTPDAIDFVLLDLNMPEMDGFEFMRRLHEHETLKDIAVVMCTGSADDNDRRRADALGAAGYLVKPASWERLKPIVDKIEGVRFKQNSEGGRLLRAE